MAINLQITRAVDIGTALDASVTLKTSTRQIAVTPGVLSMTSSIVAPNAYVLGAVSKRYRIYGTDNDPFEVIGP